jgi:hypothetical protein
VDFVSAESRRAGLNAAKYIKGEIKRNEEYITIEAINPIAYTVPQKFRRENLNKGLEVFMRVREVLRDVSLEVVSQGEVLMSLKKQHMAPGEMEKIMIPTVIAEKIKGNNIEIRIKK